MDKRIVFKNPDGSVQVLVPCSQAMLPGESDDDFAQRIVMKDGPKDESGNILSYKIIDKTDLPQDRYFRNAWIYSDSSVDIDMDKARNIHMDHIRQLRDKKLKDLDIYTLKGVDVQSQKQMLRDIPQTFDLSGAKTPDELKDLIPQTLKE